jgi:hypothetical protein
MAYHAWEDWDGATQNRMAEEMLTHGAARARLVRTGLERLAGGEQ